MANIKARFLESDVDILPPSGRNIVCGIRIFDTTRINADFHGDFYEIII